MKKIYTVILALLLSTNPHNLIAGELFEECGNINAKHASSSKRVEVISSCIGKLAKELERRPVIPAGTVIALADTRYSDQSKGNPLQEGCPVGWIRFKEAEGRFLIGADSRSNNGSGKYWVRRQDGEEKVKLKPNEIPSHSHQLPTDGAQEKNDQQSLTNSGQSDEGIGPKSLLSGSFGGQEAHNNMPPYVALYFCKKVAN